MSRESKKPSELGAAIALVLDRRRFMRGAGGTLAAATLPLTSLAETLPRESTTPTERLADWTIDDVWGPYPRYAAAIAHGPAAAGEPVEIDPLDAGLLS